MIRWWRWWAAILLLALASHAPQASAERQSFVGLVRSRDRVHSRPLERGLAEGFAQVPLQGSVYETGYFYADILVGTPSQPFSVIVDTGSVSNYVPCASCGAACGPHHLNPPFDPAASNTSELVPCDSPLCVCSNVCGCSDAQCTYSVSYAEGSSSQGIMVNDVIALSSGGEGARVTFGCATNETQEIYSQQADGVFGLGNGTSSVINQLVAEGAIDDVFSLCFGGVLGDGALLLGSAPLPVGTQLQYTPLLPSSDTPYYHVGLSGLSVGDTPLQVDPAAFSQGLGTIIDSGTTFTYLPTDAYQAFVAEVDAQVQAKGLFRMPADSVQSSSPCYGGGPLLPDSRLLGAAFPTMTLQFDQMEPLVLKSLSYLYLYSLNSGVYCLALVDHGSAGTVLGGVTFRDVLVQYDRAGMRMGFAPMDCNNLTQGPP